jgi:hypothetical protein
MMLPYKGRYCNIMQYI